MSSDFYNAEGYADPTAYAAIRTTEIKNEDLLMTLKDLSQLYYLEREIESDRERLERLRALVTNPSAPNLSGMPKGNNAENKMERYIAEIVDLESIISAKIVQSLHEQARIERYIADIPDSLTRQIFTLRFIKHLSWLGVAVAVGGGNTEAGVKMTCYRYINSKKL